MKTIADLYKPVDPFGQRKSLCKTTGGNWQKFVLRYFSPADDLLFIYQWIDRQFNRYFTEKKDFPQSLYSYYINNLQADIVQCFMVMHENKPLMQVDLLNGLYADLKHPVITDEDDGILYCFITPDQLVPKQVLACGLQLCLAWFFSFGIKRILTEIHVNNQREQEIMADIGFRLVKRSQHTLLYAFTEDNASFSDMVLREDEME